MRHGGWEMETEVHKSLENVPHPFHNGLIQNDESINLQSAKDYDSLIILRWRKRECKSCQESFDIAAEGMMYKCGVCIDERN